MFDTYIIGEGTIRNVESDGAVTGFAFDTRITYYRGLGLSMVEPFEVVLDGVAIPVENLRFTLGDRTWTFAEMAQEFDARWELTETAVLTVLLPGGLTAGEHELQVTEVLRVSYLPFLSRTQTRRRVAIAA
ncbi:MAG TPA: hypothetical protein DCM67_09610 [Propionibacteriaceae bacterium]|nr:hypothetical protein [Propionibacteriaceae bacterium]